MISELAMDAAEPANAAETASAVEMGVRSEGRTPVFPYVLRHARQGHSKGERCRLLGHRGVICAVEFENGQQTVIAGALIRRAKEFRNSLAVKSKSVRKGGRGESPEPFAAGRPAASESGEHAIVCGREVHSLSLKTPQGADVRTSPDEELSARTESRRRRSALSGETQ